jgi:type VI secretion system protein ImpH
VRHAGDRTLTSFVDVFHHRMLLLFHRAWAASQPAASLDRPEDDAFAKYFGALVGLAMATTRERDALPDRVKVFFSGRFAAAARNAEGLADVLHGHLGIPAEIESFIGQWVDIPRGGRWQLGGSPETSALGRTAVLGQRVWTRTQKFRVVLGPLGRFDLARLLPGGAAVAEIKAIVSLYTNDEWDWDLRLVLSPDANERMALGKGARLGWTSRIGGRARVREDLVVEPQLRRTRRVPARSKPA